MKSRRITTVSKVTQKAKEIGKVVINSLITISVIMIKSHQKRRF